MTKLKKIFGAVLGIEESKIGPDLSPQNTTSWDSLNSIVLLTEIEKDFDLRFDIQEAMAIKNFGEVEKLISSKGKDPNAK